MEQLLVTLQEQLATIHALTCVLLRERKAITEKNMFCLKACQEEKEFLTQKLSGLEQERDAICLGKSLREIASAPDAPVHELLQLRNSLQAAFRKMNCEHETNIVYMKLELAYIRNICTALTAMGSTNRYTDKGTIAVQQRADASLVSLFA